MDPISVPCVIEKGLKILISMGNSKPRTIAKLENALRPCRVVLPYFNPLEALEAAIKRSLPEPPVLSIQHVKERVYATANDLDRAFKFGKSLPKMAQKKGRSYDLVHYGSETEREITTEVLSWLRESDTHEGTQSDLEEEFFLRCLKEVEHTPSYMVQRLQRRGFLEICGESVVYHLLDFDTHQSECLEEIQESLTSDRNVDLLNLCASELAEFTEYGESATDLIINVVYEQCCETPFNDEAILQVRTDKRNRVTGEGLQDVLKDILVAYSLSKMSPHERPSKLADLLAFVQPERLIYAVMPSRILKQGLRKVRYRKTTRKVDRGRGRKENIEYAIGLLPGEINAQDLIPLTPEGLLGIDFEVIRHFTSNLDPSEDNTPMDSLPRWLVKDKKRASRLSKRFAADLSKQMQLRAQSQNAVIIPATEQEREVLTLRVLRWVDAQRSLGCLKSVKQLQNELIGLCTATKAKSIAPSSIPQLLIKAGYVSIQSGPTNEVSYHIPDVKSRSSASDDQAKATWQIAAGEFRQELSSSSLIYLEQAFPEETNSSNMSSSEREKGKEEGRPGKRKGSRGKMGRGRNKRRRTCKN